VTATQAAQALRVRYARDLFSPRTAPTQPSPVVLDEGTVSPPFGLDTKSRTCTIGIKNAFAEISK